ncbi:hypothetical protein KC316_g17656 [Hortaea werneckii]|nr:hypothetical protein KC316_g17656 [Hortaea werneckii]
MDDSTLGGVGIYGVAADAGNSAVTPHGTVGNTSARRENGQGIPIPSDPSKAMTTVLLPSSELQNDASPETAGSNVQQGERKRDKIMNRLKYPHKLAESGDMMSLRVTWEEKHKYFEREGGEYREEPPGGRKQWIRERLDQQNRESEAMRKQELQS